MLKCLRGIEKYEGVKQSINFKICISFTILDIITWFLLPLLLFLQVHKHKQTKANRNRHANLDYGKPYIISF